MPAFQAPLAMKRKSDFPDNEDNRKRVSLDNKETYWLIQWSVAFNDIEPAWSTLTLFRRTPTTKKHKTWTGDGLLVVNASSAVMYNMEGQRQSVLPAQFLSLLDAVAEDQVQWLCRFTRAKK